MGSFGGRGLADGEADFPHGHGKAGYRVHHHQDVLAPVAEIFGDGGGDKGAAHAQQRGLVSYNFV